MPFPDAWPPSGDAALAWLLPGYAFAQSVALSLTATDSITDGGTLELEGAWDIATFESGGSTYAAVASYDDSGVQILDITDPSDITAAGSITDTTDLELEGAWDIAIFESGGRTYDVVASTPGGSGLWGGQIIDAASLYKITAAGSAAAAAATTTTVAHPWARQNTAAAGFITQEYGQITVLNPQSYPVVGGDWTIEFRTHGIHDLAVSAIEGTTFGDYAPDDVGFVDLWCGSDSMRDATARNGVITFEDYQCHGTSSLVLRVHTPGMHDLQFSFGAGMAYASNNAYPRSAVEINDGTANGPALSDLDNFGRSVAAIGDLDGDGVPDLAAGAPGDDERRVRPRRRARHVHER